MNIYVRGSGQSMDCPAQSVDRADPRFARTIYGLLAQSVDEKESMDSTVEHARAPWRQHDASTVRAKDQY